MVKERKALGGLLRLRDLGVIAWLAPEAQPEQELLQRLPGALDWWHTHGKDVVDPLVVYVAAIFQDLGPEGTVKVAETRLRMPPPDLRRLSESVAAAERVETLLNPGDSPSTVTRALRPLPPEALVLLRARAASRGEERETRTNLLERFVTEWRHIKLEISGDVLIREGWKPGRALGQALEKTLDARLDQQVCGHDAELAFAHELLAASDEDGGHERRDARRSGG
jgi:hypothetical protein